MADSEVYDYKAAVLKDTEEFVRNPDNINLDFFRDRRGIVCRSVAADMVYAKALESESVIGVCKSSEEARRNLTGNKDILAEAMKTADVSYRQSADMVLFPEKADRLIREYLTFDSAPKALDNVLNELGEQLDEDGPDMMKDDPKDCGRISVSERMRDIMSVSDKHIGIERKGKQQYLE